jgi:S-adenosylmethionine synthetase
MSTEAAAGKNPIAHVGKIYTFLTHEIANKVYESTPGIAEVYVWLCSQIGHPIDMPLIASAQLVLKPGLKVADVQDSVEKVVERELADIYSFTERLTRGELSVV